MDEALAMCKDSISKYRGHARKNMKESNLRDHHIELEKNGIGEQKVARTYIKKEILTL